MSATTFTFKKFEIKQDLCAMKVGTDAVLLGAWAENRKAGRILDIGTGTGVIAIMLAQKNDAHITAIDIDELAYRQARENAASCPWSRNLEVKHISLQEYTAQKPEPFDLIVSNPPYFIDSYKSSEESRKNARHADQLPFDVMLKCIMQILKPEGNTCVILPVKEGQLFCELALKEGLHLNKILHVKTTRSKAEKRQLLSFSKLNTKTEESELVIEEDQRHAYSEEYIRLTRDFYLSF